MDFLGGYQGQQEASGDKHVGYNIRMPFYRSKKKVTSVLS